MNVIVTGGLGYFGSHLCADLLADGHDVLCCDKREMTAPQIAAFCFAAPPGHFAFAQRDAWHLEREDYQWAEAIVHLAAIVGEDACKIAGEEYTNYTNVNLTRHLVESYGGPLVFASTCSVYGSVPRGTMANISSPLNPRGIYARSKIEAEKIVCEAGGVALRLGTLMGYSPNMRWDLLVNEAARAARHKEELEIRNGQAMRPFITVKSASKAISLLLPKLNDGGMRGIADLVLCNVSKSYIGECAAKRGAIVRETDAGDDGRDYAVEPTVNDVEVNGVTEAVDDTMDSLVAYLKGALWVSSLSHLS